MSGSRGTGLGRDATFGVGGASGCASCNRGKLRRDRVRLNASYLLRDTVLIYVSWLGESFMNMWKNRLLNVPGST